MSITIELDVGSSKIELEPELLIVAGYTGADAAAVQHHIAELAAEGVAPPPQVPMYWAMPPGLLSQEPVVEMPSAHTSGEIEVALIVDGDELYLAAGSDHTCRQAEAIDIRLSKLICPTPLSRQAWPWAEVVDHWQQLHLASIIDTRSAEGSVRYQDATASGNRAPLDLLEAIPWGGDMVRPRCFVLLCGTVPAIGGIRPAERFTGTITDPVVNRSIELDYRIRPVRQLDPGSG